MWRISHSITRSFSYISYVRILDVKQKIRKSLNFGNFVFRWVISCIFYFSISNFDPFGFVESAANYSSSIFYRIYAPHYPTETFDDISVVLLTDIDLQALDETWPATYKMHAEVLDAILTQGPEAVMVDIGFLDDRGIADPIEPLLDIIEKYKKRDEERGVPLYFAASNPSAAFPERVRKDLAMRANLVAVPPARGESRSIAYPLSLEKPADGPAAKYSTADDFRTAAARMYLGANRTLEDEKTPIEIVWAVRGSKGDKSYYFSCEDRPKYWASQIYKNWESYISYQALSIIEFWPKMKSWPFIRSWERTKKQLSEKDRPYFRVRQTCPPHRTLMASEVYINADEPSTKEQLNGRFVFYGVYLSMVDDLVEPPTHTAIPAVYFHAMALDNLLAWGDDVIRPKRSWTVGGNNMGDVGTWISVLTLAILLLILENTIKVLDRTREETHSKLKNKIHSLLQSFSIWSQNIAISLVIVVWSCLISFFLFRLSPFNFVGFFGWVGIRMVPRIVDFFRGLLPLETTSETKGSTQ